MHGARGLSLAFAVTAWHGCGSSATVEPARTTPRVAAAIPAAVVPPAAAPADDDVPELSRKPSIRVIDPSARSGLVQFVEQLPRGGWAYVGPLAGNGGRDVLVFVPPAIDRAADFRLVYHFHGTHSERVAARRDGMAKKEWVGWDRVQQTLDAATELQARGPDNVVLVYPLSAGKRREPGGSGWFNKEYDRMWMAPAPPAYTDDFETLHAEVLELLRTRFSIPAERVVDDVIAEGHSAGGIALLNIARSGTRRVGEYLFLDASFQGWADGCWTALRAVGDDALVSLVVTRNGIADPFGKPDPWCTRLEHEAGLWQRAQPSCSGRIGGRSCAELEQSARDWDRDRTWCAGMRDGGLPGVFVHVTRIAHGKQPRHFVGGLELPADRARRARDSTAPP